MGSKVLWYVYKYFWVTLKLIICLQMSVRLALYDRQSLDTGRSDILSWSNKFPGGAVFIVLEGHATVETGELLWQSASGRGNYDYMPRVCFPLILRWEFSVRHFP
jgi:hypothetical protein